MENETGNTISAAFQPHCEDSHNVADDVTTSNDDSSKTAEGVKPAKRDVDFDDLMELSGLQFGRFQFVVFVLLSLGILVEVMLVMAYVFIAATPDHWCSTPQLDGLNLTDDVRRNVTIPLEDDDAGQVNRAKLAA